jgi:hypothetical protein
MIAMSSGIVQLDEFYAMIVCLSISNGPNGVDDVRMEPIKASEVNPKQGASGAWANPGFSSLATPSGILH